MLSENAVQPGEFEYYITLVWLFVFLFAFLMILLFYLFLAKRRAEEREAMKHAISHLAIEGMETERRRISQELHDTVLPLVRDPFVSDLIRSICTELMPLDFTHFSLKEALAALCDKFAGRSGIECACSIDEELDSVALSAENKLHLFRITQEAFTNIEKHSKAVRSAFVARRLLPPGRKVSEKILICISDDGLGLKSKPGLANAESLGMMNMRRRAAALGARLDFISESDNGLMVRLEIPISEVPISEVSE
ncbi:MAG: histidine kinase [Treponema sp.]|nr:histidine kinase [Treponema sp.]